MNTYTGLVIAGVAAIVVMAVVFGMDVAKMTIGGQDYELFVDPIIDKQNLFTTGRITIQNTGSQPLSNVRVNFGGGETLDLGTMEPRQKVLVSPPPNNSMEFVQVSADPGVFVSKAYRELPKMVGMMGS